MNNHALTTNQPLPQNDNILLHWAGCVSGELQLTNGERAIGFEPTAKRKECVSVILHLVKFISVKQIL